MSTPVNNYGYTYQTQAAYDAQKNKSVEETKNETASATAAEETAQKEDSFEKSAPVAQTTYKPDMDKVNAMKADLQGNVAAFKKMVQGLFGKQGNMADSAMSQLMEIDEQTQLEAQQAISEDGEWGVNAVANRILDFAKAISGGDPAKIEALRQAVKDGFGEAEKVWGGTLPDISYQTLDKIMEGFDAWANEGKTESVETA